MKKSSQSNKKDRHSDLTGKRHEEEKKIEISQDISEDPNKINEQMVDNQKVDPTQKPSLESPTPISQSHKNPVISSESVLNKEHEEAKSEIKQASTGESTISPAKVNSYFDIFI